MNSKVRTPTGKSTEIFTWSPLPQRKRTLNFTEKKHEYKLNENAQFYPNCDVNVWLRSCEKEILEPIKGVVTGDIPEWLNGTLLRNGPGSIKAGNEYFAHLFDASALLHRFCIENRQVTYQCRFVQSDVYKRNRQANRIVLTEFGTKGVPDPCHSIFDRIASIFNPKSTQQTDNSLISLYPFGDAIYAFNEVPSIHRINPETLETEGKIVVSDYVSIVHHTSHPHVTEDGSVYNLGLTVYPTGPYHTIVKFPFNESNREMFDNASIIARIPARWPLHPSYMHTFGMTENYFIIVEQPLNLSLPAMVAAKLKNEPLAGCFRWYQDQMTQFNLIDRQTGKLAYKFYSETFFYLHIINQYEIDDYVIVDICIYKDPSMLDCMYIETMKSMQQNQNYAKMFRSRPVRFVLPLKPEINRKNLIELLGVDAEAYFMASGEILVKGEKLCELGCETPRIHYERYLGKFYRYFYAISADVDANNPGTIIKVDTKLKATKTWCSPNCYPSEPIFVPNPNPDSEDDGVVLSAMVWGGDDTNHVGLIVLDAKTFKELARAEFWTSSPVPKCLHGWFIPMNRGFFPYTKN